MKWQCELLGRKKKTVKLTLVLVTGEERKTAEALIEVFRNCGATKVASIAYELDECLQKRRMTTRTLRRLSQWCDARKKGDLPGRQPAQSLFMFLFDTVVDRLVDTKGDPVENYNQLLEEFCVFLNSEDDIAPMIDTDELPGRRTTTVSPVIRNRALAKKLKEEYDYCCQLCRQSMAIPFGSGRYAEVHHLRPLGLHSGQDTRNNMIVLCPTCHKKFDWLAVAIRPGSEDLQLKWFDPDDPLARIRNLYTLANHKLAQKNIEHHWESFLSIQSKCSSAS